MPSPERIYRGSVRAFSIVFIALGLAILVSTFVQGGGPLSIGTLLGIAFLAVGVGRVWVARRTGGEPPSQDPRAGTFVKSPEGRPRSRLEPLLERGLGVPGLFVAVYSAVGFSIYFALGVVADRGLGLTPLIFLAAGLLFVLTTLSYVEGGAMFRERGGSSSFARHAFNELIAFIAGWAILIDYLIVAALAAISVPHYLKPVASGLSAPGWEIGVAVAVIVAACVLNVVNVTGRGRQGWLIVLALADIALQVAVIVVGVLAVFHPERLTEQLDLFTDPSLTDVVYAAVVAMLAYAGIEAASDLAPDIDVRPRDLRRIVSVGAVAVPLVYAGMAAIALMAVPVVAGPDGPQTALGSEFVEAPVLGVVSAYQPGWVADAMRWIVALVAAPVLFWAATTSMLGVSRHIYTLAINRQIPSWLGKLNARHATPHVAIVLSGLIAIGLVVPDRRQAAGRDLRLRGDPGDHDRPPLDPAPAGQRARSTPPVPGSLGRRVARGAQLPVPALFAAVLSGLAFLSVLAFHDTARWVGGGWMLFGLAFYVVYRKVVRGNHADPARLGDRAGADQAGARARLPQHPRAGLRHRARRRHRRHRRPPRRRRAARADNELDERPARPRLRGRGAADPAARRRAVASARRRPVRTLQRAREVAEEYEDVEVSTDTIRAREVGAGIVEAARRSEAEAIVIGGEPPTKIRGGAMLGGIGAAKPAEIGAATEYVLKKAPCRVLLDGTARARAVTKPRLVSGPMFILIVGCGRVGSSVARTMLHEGHEVSCLDEDPESHTRLEVGLDRAGRTSAAASRSAPAWRPTRCSRPGSRRRTPSSPRPTATTRTSSSPRSPSAATRCRR